HVYHSCLTSYSSRAAPPTLFYTLSLHDALPISFSGAPSAPASGRICADACRNALWPHRVRAPRNPATRCRRNTAPCRRDSTAGKDRKSTRLNSSHVKISYAVFCLKKKKKNKKTI